MFVSIRFMESFCSIFYYVLLILVWRFYIVEFDSFTKNFELYIFFYVFYQHNIGRKEKKPAIGVEPMTIALQMRCSNLWAKWAHIRKKLLKFKKSQIWILNFDILFICKWNYIIHSFLVWNPLFQEKNSKYFIHYDMFIICFNIMKFNWRFYI